MALPQVVPTYTLQAVTVSDCAAVNVSPTSGGGFTFNATFNVRDAGGVVRESRSVSVPLSGSPLTALANFITANIVPVANAQ